MTGVSRPDKKYRALRSHHSTSVYSRAMRLLSGLLVLSLWGFQPGKVQAEEGQSINDEHLPQIACLDNSPVGSACKGELHVRRT